MKIVKWLFSLLVVLVSSPASLPGQCRRMWPIDIVAARLGPVSLVGVAARSGMVMPMESACSGAISVSSTGRSRRRPCSRAVCMPTCASGAPISIPPDLIERDSDGEVTAHDVRFRVPGSCCRPALDLPSLKLLGTVTGTFAEARCSTALCRCAAAMRAGPMPASAAAPRRASPISLPNSPRNPMAASAEPWPMTARAISRSMAHFEVAATGFNAEAFLPAQQRSARAGNVALIGEQQPDGTSICSSTASCSGCSESWPTNSCANALGVAHAAADAAEAGIHARYRARDFSVDAKADETPVTEADREAEIAIKDVLRAAFPTMPSSARNMAARAKAIFSG